MQNSLHLVCDVFVRVVVVLGEISCARSLNVVKRSFQISGIFFSVLACKFLLYSCRQKLYELLSEPTVVVSFRSSETVDTVDEEQSQCLYWQSVTAEVFALGLEVAHQRKFYHSFLIGHAILVGEELFSGLFLLTIAQADAVLCDSIYSHSVEVAVYNAETVTGMHGECL